MDVKNNDNLSHTQVNLSLLTANALFTKFKRSFSLNATKPQFKFQVVLFVQNTSTPFNVKIYQFIESLIQI